MWESTPQTSRGGQILALLAGFSLELAQEVRHFHNRNTAVLPERQNMARVAADDVIRASGIRAFKDAVVGRVGGDDVKLMGGLDTLGGWGRAAAKLCLSPAPAMRTSRRVVFSPLPPRCHWK